MIFLPANITQLPNMETALATLLYIIVGIVALIVSYKAFDVINPLDFDKEIANNNTALAIMLAGFFLGVAIVIAAAIFG